MQEDIVTAILGHGEFPFQGVVAALGEGDGLAKVGGLVLHHIRGAGAGLERVQIDGYVTGFLGLERRDELGLLVDGAGTGEAVGGAHQEGAAVEAAALHLVGQELDVQGELFPFPDFAGSRGNLEPVAFLALADGEGNAALELRQGLDGDVKLVAGVGEALAGKHEGAGTERIHLGDVLVAQLEVHDVVFRDALGRRIPGREARALVHDVVHHEELEGAHEADAAALSAKEVVGDVGAGFGAVGAAAGLDVHALAGELVTQAGEDVVVQEGRALHAALDGNAHQGALEAVVKAAHVALSAVHFDAVVVAEGEEIAVDIGIAVETAVLVKVAEGLDGVVEAVHVPAAHEVVVAHHGGVVGLVHDEGLRTGRVRVAPGVRASGRIVHVAAFHHHVAGSLLDLDGPVKVDDILAHGGFAFLVKAHLSHAAPVAHLAVEDTHVVAVLDIDGPRVDVGPFHGHAFQDDVLGAVNEEGDIPGSVLQHGARRHGVADPAVLAALVLDLDGETELGRVQDDGPCNGHLAAPGAELLLFHLFPVHQDAALVVAVLVQAGEAGAVTGLVLIEGEEPYRRPFDLAFLAVFDAESGNGGRCLHLQGAGIEGGPEHAVVIAGEEGLEGQHFHAGGEDDPGTVGVSVAGGAGGIVLHAVHDSRAHAHLVELAVFDVFLLEGVPGREYHVGIFGVYPLVGDGMGDGAGEQGRAGSLFEGLAVQHVHPHAAAALPGTQAVNLALEISQNAFEIGRIGIQAVQQVHGGPDDPAVAPAPVEAGLGPGLLEPGVPVEFGLRIPEVLVQVVHLPDGVPEHERVAIVRGIARHERKAHEQVVGPQGALAGPGAHQGSVLETGLAVADVLCGALNQVLVFIGAEPAFHVDEGPALRAHEVQLVKAAESVVGMPVTGGRVGGTHFVPLIQAVVHLPAGMIRILFVSAQGGILQEGRVDDAGGVMPAGVVGAQADPLVGRDIGRYLIEFVFLFGEVAGLPAVHDIIRDLPDHRAVGYGGPGRCGCEKKNQQ